MNLVGTMSEAALQSIQGDTDLYRDLGAAGHVDIEPDGSGTVTLSEWTEFLSMTREQKGPGGTKWLAGLLAKLTENLLRLTEETQQVERDSRRNLEEAIADQP